MRILHRASAFLLVPAYVFFAMGQPFFWPGLVILIALIGGAFLLKSSFEHLTAKLVALIPEDRRRIVTLFGLIVVVLAVLFYAYA